MAAKVSRGTVKGEGDRAIGALDHLAALTTLDEGGIPTAVEEEDRLLPLFNPIAYGRDETRREDTSPLFRGASLLRAELAQIDDLNRGRGPPLHPFV
jgi:hypothetical protein